MLGLKLNHVSERGPRRLVPSMRASVYLNNIAYIGTKWLSAASVSTGQLAGIFVWLPFAASVIVNSNLAKSRLPITGISFVRFFLQFCKEHIRDTGVLCAKFWNELANEYKLWANEISWDLSLWCVSEAYSRSPGSPDVIGTSFFRTWCGTYTSYRWASARKT